jgi:oligogalacturonide lyase
MVQQPWTGGWTRRSFTAAIAAIFASRAPGKEQVYPDDRRRFLDPATEFEIVRLTDPSHSSHLPGCYGRAISRRGDQLYFSSDRPGSFQAFRMDLRSGVSVQLTETKALDPQTLTLLPEERSFCYFSAGRLMISSARSPKERELYSTTSGWKHGRGFTVSDDGLYGAFAERRESRSRLRLLHLVKGAAQTVIEQEGELRDPIIRPRRAGILYLLNDEPWLVNFDGKDNRRLRVAPGRTGSALWSPDGKSLFYLNFPAERGKLNTLREHTPDAGADALISSTSQFVLFNRNSDASVFVGVSGSKASPHVLLLVRAVKRELTLCEHRASDPLMVSPIFSPSSQRIYYESDKHGKPALYTMAVDRLVEKTED